MIDRGKHSVLGILVNAVDNEAVLTRITAAATTRKSLSVSALAVHGVMTGFLDDEHRFRLNCIDCVVPDGQPVRWALNWLHGIRLPDRVYGPKLMLQTCAEAMRLGLPVFLYGSTNEVIEKLAANLRREFPQITIAGKQCSRFRRLSPEEKQQLVRQIEDSGARIVFVALGCPRQEVWAYEFRDSLPLPILAIGAAFAFHAGTIAQAPAWMQRYGLEWLFRLACDPARLWKRYLLLNPLYLATVLLQLAGLRFDTSGRKPQGEVLYG